MAITTTERHRILLQTDPTIIKTGLAENARTLLKHWYKQGKYDIATMWQQGSMTNDPRLGFQPWSCFGSIPPDQNLIDQVNKDPGLRQHASYGAYNIDNVIKEWKPTIWIGSNDLWSFQVADYMDKSWYKQINSIPHITIDSVPILPLAFEQAKRSKHYLTWAPFGARAMRTAKPQEMAHVSSIYGAMDTTQFSPISTEDQLKLRAQLKVDPTATIFLFVFRNQLRKSAVKVMEAFKMLKAQHPEANVKLHFHTSFSEKHAGWDIPMWMERFGIKKEDMLATYVCRECGRWWVAPYTGEDVKCHFCGGERSGITANIQHGVPSHEMRLVYGLSDACVSAFTSGGQEYHSVQSLLCGRYLACTNYSCGEDFCTDVTKDFVYPLAFATYEEMNTNYTKSATDAKDIAAFMRQVLKSSRRELLDRGMRGRQWAVDTFGIEAIGKQWDDLFAKMPLVDWGKIELTKVDPKNDQFPLPDASLSNHEFVTLLYKAILKMDVPPTDQGYKDWMANLMNGGKREDIHAFFINVARQENAKNQPQQDFWTLIDKTTGRKRALFVMKESIGDCVMITQLFGGFHKKHPNHDLYVMTDPKYFSVFDCNPHVFRVVPYVPGGENEMLMCGAGQDEGYFHLYYHPGILTQRQLFYLFS